MSESKFTLGQKIRLRIGTGGHKYAFIQHGDTGEVEDIYKSSSTGEFVYEVTCGGTLTVVREADLEAI